MDSSPPLFASDDATTFDTKLFNVTENELDQMSLLFPEFAEMLTVPVPGTTCDEEGITSFNVCLGIHSYSALYSTL